jgi:hypothetical protein
MDHVAQALQLNETIILAVWEKIKEAKPLETISLSLSWGVNY